jgi:hypothetical protein
MKNIFFEILKRIDELIAAGPEHVEYTADLEQNLNNLQIQRYFFTQLQSPQWIEPLFRAGAFNTVLEPVKDANSIAFPFWAPADYLMRMATLSPELVTEVALSIPSTQNLRIHDSLATAMISVPAKLASTWASKEARWLSIQQNVSLSLPTTLGKLMQHLASQGEAAAALNLAAPLLAVLDASLENSDNAQLKLITRLREPRTRIGLWEYEQILAKNMPVVTLAAGLDTLHLLCDLLDHAIVASDLRGSEIRPNDMSRIWRPAIEDHAQNINRGIKPLLVTGVRDAAEQIARANPKSVPLLTDTLDARSQSWTVFRRISLHLLRLFSDSTAPLIRNHLLDRASFDDLELLHEYFLLMQKCFRDLSDGDQEQILKWIESGPILNTEQLKNWESNIRRSVTEADKRAFTREWQREHLAPIADQLPEKWKALYAELLREEEAPPHPEFSTYYQSGGRGPGSPVNRDEVAGKTPVELVSYLNSWAPGGEQFRGPTTEGLGRMLSDVISTDPGKYSADLPAFTKLTEPTYVRAIVQGYHNVLRQEQTFDWAPVLDFCVWAVSQVKVSRDYDVGSQYFQERDPDWGWTKTTVARLLADGMASKSNPIPFIHRTQVWTGIVAGTTETDPTPETEGQEFSPAGIDDDEAKKTETRVDLMTRAINSARGVAIGAVVDYALWVRRNFEKSNNSEVLLRSGLKSMLEVKGVLESHLDMKIDRSLTIRAIYGQRAPWLQLLDPGWAADNTVRIFDQRDPKFWHAAWDTYVGYSNAYDNVFIWLRGEYAHAVEEIGKHRHFWANPESPDFSLAQHLMTLYWRGRLDRTDPLMTGFYRSAGASLCKHALNFVGRSLRNTDAVIPSDVLVRLKDLWTDRVAAVTRANGAGAEELQEYGWWFVSRKFEDQWSLEQRLAALFLAHRVDADFMVVDRLAELASGMPASSVEALRMIAESDPNGWSVSGWSDKAKEILRIARNSKNPDASRNAEKLINYLGSLGYFDFGDLLKESSD